MTIDWTKPLESAVDGAPLVLKATTEHGTPDEFGDYYLVREDGLPPTKEQFGGSTGGAYLIVDPEGRHWTIGPDSQVLVRNRAETPAAAQQVQGDDGVCLICGETEIKCAEERERQAGSGPRKSPFPTAERIGQLAPTPQSPTLRDQFAMAALTGLIAGGMDVNCTRYEDMAAHAGAIADAMVAERQKGNEK